MSDINHYTKDNVLQKLMNIIIQDAEIDNARKTNFRGYMMRKTRRKHLENLCHMSISEWLVATKNIKLMKQELLNCRSKKTSWLKTVVRDYLILQVCRLSN